MKLCFNTGFIACKKMCYRQLYNADQPIVYPVRTLHCLGKSTAAKCALALLGQHKAGNIMKIKATSEHILCIERIVNSS